MFFPDYVALSIADKALSVIFIILICVTNIALVGRQLSRPMFYRNAKLMAIISLAVGDIILALFPGVITAKIYFNQQWIPICRVNLLSSTYFSLMHFVFGIGLVVLCAESHLRDFIKKSGKETASALVLSSVPWIIGLIVILPLCLVNAEYDFFCRTGVSLKVIIAVSVFVPTSLAVLVCVVNICVTYSTVKPHQIVGTRPPPVVYYHNNVAIPVNQETQYSATSGVNSDSYLHKQDNAKETNLSLTFQPSMTNTPQLQPTAQQSQAGYYQQPGPVYITPHSHQTTVQQGYYQPGVVNIGRPNGQTVAPFGAPSSNRRKEAIMLLAIAIFYFVMVLPNSGVAITNIDWPNPLMFSIVTQTVSWLSMARSWVTPIMMFFYSKF
ncbi:uncharacterized protein LOC106066846 [Biomphalaria glabrata]|uniref:Uncharacterized protein LOC106066846 n=1 Tax=Biomphalaria glabrata TaxID=6526 RepID=A0A9W3BGA0_BIOGL|nr:uncharacterized protein LOC106066846 [Biomphalaria glabrata]